jgi:hypothetical protein
MNLDEGGSKVVETGEGLDKGAGEIVAAPPATGLLRAFTIAVTQEYALQRDTYSWAIARRRKHKRAAGGYTWEQVKWFPTLTMAADRLAEMLRDCTPSSTLDELVQKARAAETTVAQALRRLGEASSGPR